MDRCNAVQTIRGRPPGPNAKLQGQLWEGHGGPHWGRMAPDKGTPAVWHTDKGSRQGGWKFNAAIAVTVLIVLLIAATAMSW